MRGDDFCALGYAAQTYRQREVVVKIAFLQSFENQNERIHQSSNPPKSGYKNVKNDKTRHPYSVFRPCLVAVFQALIYVGRKLLVGLVEFAHLCKHIVTATTGAAIKNKQRSAGKPKSTPYIQ